MMKKSIIEIASRLPVEARMRLCWGHRLMANPVALFNKHTNTTVKSISRHLVAAR